MATSEHSAILFWAEHDERSSSVAVTAWQQREGMAERGNEWTKKEEKSEKAGRGKDGGEWKCLKLF